jgi:hypothetical protein
MYIKEKKLIFIHIPKNAGTSIEYTLGNIYFQNLNNFYKKIYFYSTEKNPTFFKFIYFYFFIIKIIINLITRRSNPLDNFIIGNIDNTLCMHLSAKQYKNILQDEYDNNIKFTIIRNPYTRIVSIYNYITPGFIQSRRHFIEFLLDIKYNKLNDNCFNNQYSYVIDENGNNIVDEYIKFENINDEWFIFCKKYDIPYNKLSTINSKKKKDLYL